jgi:hypothetical protein
MPVTAKHIESIYKAFRKAQADYNNRGYKMPRDFEKHFNTKFSEPNKKALIKITGWFLTKWKNINQYDYFMCGFELFKKGFTYTKFFDEKIILLYKTRDKNKKREIHITKKKLIESALVVKVWMEKHNASLDDYMSTREGYQKIAIRHYLDNKIDATFLVFLIQKGMILTDTERSVIPYVQANYRKIICGLGEIRNFTKKLGEKL